MNQFLQLIYPLKVQGENRKDDMEGKLQCQVVLQKDLGLSCSI